MVQAASSEEKIGHELTATSIMSKYTFATLIETEEILAYKDGVYADYGEVVIKELCEQLVARCSNGYVSEVIGHIKRRTYVSIEEFDKDPSVLNLKNGLLDITSGAVEEHSEHYLSRIMLPVFYEPHARCPNFLKFLTEVLPDPQDRRVLIEEFASTLWCSPSLEKGFIWVGTGGNGKSTMLKILVAILGTKNVSNESIHNLLFNRFADAELVAKLANIYADISSDELGHTGKIKSLISGDRMNVEHKHKDPFPFSNYAKLFFSCNVLPYVYDDSDAFFRRWIITIFPNTFEGNNANTALIEELTTPQELSGIFNIMIGVVRQLIQRGRFSYSPTSDQVRKEWMERADIIGAFLSKFVVHDTNGDVEKARLYSLYVKWCQEMKYIAKPNKAFNEQLRSKVAVEGGQRRIAGKLTKIWKGIRLQDGIDTKGSEPSTDATQDSIEAMLLKAELNQATYDKLVIIASNTQDFMEEDLLREAQKVDDSITLVQVKKFLEEAQHAGKAFCSAPERWQWRDN